MLKRSLNLELKKSRCKNRRVFFPSSVFFRRHWTPRECIPKIKGDFRFLFVSKNNQRGKQNDSALALRFFFVIWTSNNRDVDFCGEKKQNFPRKKRREDHFLFFLLFFHPNQKNNFRRRKKNFVPFVGGSSSTQSARKLKKKKIEKSKKSTRICCSLPDEKWWKRGRCLFRNFADAAKQFTFLLFGMEIHWLSFLFCSRTVALAAIIFFGLYCSNSFKYHGDWDGLVPRVV